MCCEEKLYRSGIQMARREAWGGSDSDFCRDCRTGSRDSGDLRDCLNMIGSWFSLRSRSPSLQAFSATMMLAGLDRWLRAVVGG
jgi:hypothetical protein